MIEILETLDDSISKKDIPAEDWLQWEANDSTIHYKQQLKEDLIRILNALTDNQSEQETQFRRGQIQALDRELNYKPENVKDD